jgi:hypothetical protein
VRVFLKRAGVPVPRVVTARDRVAKDAARRARSKPASKARA